LIRVLFSNADISLSDQEKGLSMSAEEALDLGTCAREPIHVPGSIQPHGLLLVVDQNTDLILQAAGDAAYLLNFSGSILGKSVETVLGVALADLVLHEETDLRREPGYIGTLGPFGDRQKLIITAHLMDGAAILEAEPSIGPETNPAKALANIRSIIERIGGNSDLIEACQLAASEVRRITAYDRVMIYRFLADSTGSVIAEAKDAALSSFLNHRFPASDIPKQARELYQRNMIRVIPDVGYIPAPLVPALSPRTNQPVDMSNCNLRSVSPVHIQYLKNMGVDASMSVSLVLRDELWGLIACHNVKTRLVSYEAREACRHVGQILSQEIRVREESDGYRIAAELGSSRAEVIGALMKADDPGALLVDLCAELQAIVHSHGVAVVRNGAIATAGQTPSETQIRQLAVWLEQRASGSDFFATDCLSREYPPAEAFASHICGLFSLVLPSDDQVVLMWFRAEQIEEIHWAGNPHKPAEPGSGPDVLNPRKSFATWRETVRGRSQPWQPVEIDALRELGPRAAFVLQQKRVRELNHLLAEVNEKLAALALTDGLTGLANRRAFDQYLEKEWARAGRPPFSPLAVIILDLDSFKQYNDHYGHVAGDECLKQVANALQGGRRATDLTARIGGEEFAILLPATDVDGAMTVAETLRQRIEGLQLEHTGSPMGVVTASFGVTVAKYDKNEKLQHVMQAADKALYSAKVKGRNRVAFDLMPSDIGSAPGR
jgi:diguanylate cyclase (GGDEF)-like protein